MAERKYIAVDLGAESGRVMLASVSEAGISLQEMNRFANVSVRVGRTLHWDMLRLWHDIQQGIGKAVQAAGGAKNVSGIGVDTWGVDFGLLAEDGTLLGNPVCYRDDRTQGVPEKVWGKIDRKRIYEITGIQSMVFNTIYQLAALRMSGASWLKNARHLLYVPDLLNYWLCGKLANEYTIASTSMLLDARSRQYSSEILKAIDVPASLFPEVVMPATAGSVLGTVQASVGDAIGATGIPVIAVGSHDTGSAVAAIPGKGEDWLYLSSGTWSLLGAEIDQPVLTEKAAEINITNEGGVGGKIRLLKNIIGMWPLQECRRSWAAAGQDIDYATLAKMAGEAAPGLAKLDMNDPPLALPGNMPEKIVAQCKRTGQKAPSSPGEFARVIFESLAGAYADVGRMISELTGKTYRRLHIVGGGSKNDLLNQMAADATGMTVHAGPVEATALGNVMSQAISTGQIGSIEAGRALIGRGGEMREFRGR